MDLLFGSGQGSGFVLALKDYKQQGPGTLRPQFSGAWDARDHPLGMPGIIHTVQDPEATLRKTHMEPEKRPFKDDTNPQRAFLQVPRLCFLECKCST